MTPRSRARSWTQRTSCRAGPGPPCGPSTWGCLPTTQRSVTRGAVSISGASGRQRWTHGMTADEGEHGRRARHACTFRIACRHGSECGQRRPTDWRSTRTDGRFANACKAGSDVTVSCVEPLPTRADVVVVGAGHNGLVAATMLARAGMSVVVVERDHVVGGAARTEQPFAKVPGLRQSTGAYLLGLMPPELEQLLDLRLPLVRRDPHYFLPTAMPY